MGLNSNAEGPGEKRCVVFQSTCTPEPSVEMFVVTGMVWLSEEFRIA